jgi:K+-transporting ATPase c subunit
VPPQARDFDRRPELAVADEDRRGKLGEPRVNVLLLNIALDVLK